MNNNPNAAVALNVAQHIERQLDNELKLMSNLNDDDFVELRRQRAKALQERSNNMQRWRSQGHGEYTEIGDEKQFFDICKTSERVVCHFYRNTTHRCQIVDKHMIALAKKHIETKFIKLEAEKCPFLAQRLNIVVLPAIVLTVNNQTAGLIEGFDELGGRDDFTTNTLEQYLAKKGVIEYEEPPAHFKAKMNKDNENNYSNSIRSGDRNKQQWDSDDSDDD